MNKLVVGPDGPIEVEMTPEEESAWIAGSEAGAIEAANVLQASGIEKARKESLSSDASYLDLLTRARTATPQQIDTWLTANMTNLAQARAVVGALIKVIAVKLT